MTKPQDDYIKTALRLPRDLHAEISEAAVEHGRSMNSEIIDRLGRSSTDPSLADIAQQNIKTQELVLQIIAAIGPRPGRGGG